MIHVISEKVLSELVAFFSTVNVRVGVDACVRCRRKAKWDSEKKANNINHNNYDDGSNMSSSNGLNNGLNTLTIGQLKSTINKF